MSLAARPDIEYSGARAADDIAAPIGADAFATCMESLGPFESRPHLAIGVSGGRDSLALALLAAEWAAARHGQVVAVTLDHGLRTTSAAEAAQVSSWMGQHGIPHQTLIWPDSPGPDLPGRDKAGGASEADARSARYGLLAAFCRDRGILHLLVGHHHDDQLETRAMRRARASGPFGQAGMPAVRELRDMRVLRPLLGFPRARITATLRARQQDWIEDPSNRDTRFARARMRLDRSTELSVGPDDDLAGARVVAERAVARIAARAVAVHPAGFAMLDPVLLDAADRETGTRLIANLVTCIGGRIYPPRGPRLMRLADHLLDGGLGGGATLGGCTVKPAGNGLVRFAREQAATEPPRDVIPIGDTMRAPDWDGRFRVTFPAKDRAGVASASGGDARLGAVGHFSASGVPMHPDSPRYDELPHPVRMALPAICRDGHFHICALPFVAETGLFAAKARFTPRIPVAGAVFATS